MEFILNKMEWFVVIAKKKDLEKNSESKSFQTVIFKWYSVMLLLLFCPNKAQREYKLLCDG